MFVFKLVALMKHGDNADDLFKLLLLMGTGTDTAAVASTSSSSSSSSSPVASPQKQQRTGSSSRMPHVVPNLLNHGIRSPLPGGGQLTRCSRGAAIRPNCRSSSSSSSSSSRSPSRDTSPLNRVKSEPSSQLQRSGSFPIVLPECAHPNNPLSRNSPKRLLPPPLQTDTNDPVHGFRHSLLVAMERDPLLFYSLDKSTQEELAVDFVVLTGNIPLNMTDSLDLAHRVCCELGIGEFSLQFSDSVRDDMDLLMMFPKLLHYSIEAKASVDSCVRILEHAVSKQSDTTGIMSCLGNDPQRSRPVQLLALKTDRYAGAFVINNLSKLSANIQETRDLVLMVAKSIETKEDSGPMFARLLQHGDFEMWNDDEFVASMGREISLRAVEPLVRRVIQRSAMVRHAISDNWGPDIVRVAPDDQDLLRMKIVKHPSVLQLTHLRKDSACVSACMQLNEFSLAFADESVRVPLSMLVSLLKRNEIDFILGILAGGVPSVMDISDRQRIATECAHQWARARANALLRAPKQAFAKKAVGKSSSFKFLR